MGASRVVRWAGRGRWLLLLLRRSHLGLAPHHLRLVMRPPLRDPFPRRSRGSVLGLGSVSPRQGREAPVRSVGGRGGAPPYRNAPAVRLSDIVIGGARRHTGMYIARCAALLPWGSPSQHCILGCEGRRLWKLLALPGCEGTICRRRSLLSLPRMWITRASLGVTLSPCRAGRCSVNTLSSFTSRHAVGSTFLWNLRHRGSSPSSPWRGGALPYRGSSSRAPSLPPSALRFLA